MYNGTLKPSSADIWTKCPAQPLIVQTHVPPAPPTEPAMEGTCAAWLAEVIINAGGLLQCRDLVGELCPENNWPVDYEMANLVQGYVDLILNRGGEIRVEKRVNLTDRIGGLPDCSALFRDQHLLIVDDLKYGYSPVEPTSAQIVIYAAAIANNLRCFGDTDIRHVQLGIYQPRAFHPDGVYRKRTITIYELMDEAQQVINAGALALGENPMICPGRHCKTCPAAHVCPGVSSELADMATWLRASQARQLTVDEMANQLTFLETIEDMVKGFKTAVEGEALARIESGQSIPGWDMKRGNGRRRYTMDRETIKTLIGVDPSSESMCTPAELERRGVDPELVKLVTETPQTKPKLTRLSKRHFAEQFGE